MLYYSLIFLIFTAIMGIFGFSGITIPNTEITRYLFFGFFTLFLGTLSIKIYQLIEEGP